MPNAAEVAGMLKGYNEKVVDYTPKQLLKAGKTIKIFNVGQKSWIQYMGSLGAYTIQACEPGRPHSHPCEVPFMVEEHIAVDMKKMIPRLHVGADVANDIIGIGPFKGADQDLRRYGVFIAEGDVPSKAELEAANEALRNTQIALVKEGDDLAMANKVDSISADHRNAVAFLKQDRDWARMPKQLVQCPGCGENVNPDAAVHAGAHGCGAVLNEQKVIKLKLKGYEHLWAEKAKA